MPNSDQTISRPKVAYMMSRFPKITETFVLYEMIAVEKAGVDIEIYPLMREHTTVMHPEAPPLVARAHFLPFISLDIVRSNLQFMLRKPRAYWGTLLTALRATWGSRRYFVGILAFFPKTVHMARLMADDGITHIHAHFASHPTAAAYIIHHLTGIPYSFTAHGSDLHREKRMLCEKLNAARFAVTISQYNYETMITTCGAHMVDRLMIIHCGVDTNAFAPEPTTNEASAATHSAASDDTSLNIACIGTLHEVKGQSYLIEACQRLHERGIPFECHLIGDGEDRAMLETKVAQANMTDQVTFHGYLTHDGVTRLVKQADVVVTPSVPSNDGRREGIPVATMEAMACGVPVVASRLSGIPELVDDGETGILVEPRDVTGIADALQQLAQDEPRRQRLGYAGRAKIMREFSLSANAETLARLFAGESS
ncbi:MAG: glycosyltransferase family 4 protein [Anaerolineae bacterium]|nr:glycosyltransferase family 4 protein [Anaerolineae bacterium]